MYVDSSLGFLSKREQHGVLNFHLQFAPLNARVPVDTLDERACGGSVVEIFDLAAAPMHHRLVEVEHRWINDVVLDEELFCARYENRRGGKVRIQYSVQEANGVATDN